MISVEEKKLAELLNSFVGRRFETIDELCNSIAVNNGIWKINLVEEKQEELIGDYILIGQIGIVNNEESKEYDIQLYFIRDNQNNYYITETDILWEL